MLQLIVETMDDSESVTKIEDTLSVLNPPKCIFRDEDNKSKSLFESLFREIDSDAVFCYLNSFCQVRIVFSSGQKAKEVLERINGVSFMNETLRLRFTQYVQYGSSNLQIPEQDQLFLISPPSTPPIGWVQVREAHPSQPNIEEMLQALQVASSTGEPIKLHSGSGNIPSILVHTPCDEEVTPRVGTSSVKISSCPPQMVHTARPP